jgi:hypothetical protein
MSACSDFGRFSGISSNLGVVGVAIVVTLVNGSARRPAGVATSSPSRNVGFSPIAASLIIAVLWAGWHPVLVCGLTCGAIVWTSVYNRR